MPVVPFHTEKKASATRSKAVYAEMPKIEHVFRGENASGSRPASTSFLIFSSVPGPFQYLYAVWESWVKPNDCSSDEIDSVIFFGATITGGRGRSNASGFAETRPLVVLEMFMLVPVM